MWGYGEGRRPPKQVWDTVSTAVPPLRVAQGASVTSTERVGGGDESET